MLGKINTIKYVQVHILLRICKHDLAFNCLSLVGSFDFFSFYEGNPIGDKIET